MKTIFTLRRLIAPLSAVAVFASCYSLAQADDVSEAHLAAAQKAITAIHATDKFDDFLPGTARDLKNELTLKDPNFSDVISSTVDQQALELAKRRGDLEREAARAFAKHFTEQELNQIAAFYESGAGKKLLAEGPVATRDILQAFQVWREGIAQDLATNVGKALNDKLSTKTQTVNPAAGSPQPTAN